jgi:protein-disulfide isomerase
MPPAPKAPSSSSGSRRNLVIALAVGAVVAIALIGASIVLTGGDDEATTTATTDGTTTTPVGSLEGIPQSGTVLGSPDATVTLFQYEDIQCPVCQRYTEESFPTIVDEYVRTGQVKVDFRGLAFLGEDSLKALRIALAAGKQDKLWEVVEAFYARQGEENSGWVTDELVDEILADIPGLDAGQVLTDAQSAEIEQEVTDVQDEAQAREVPGTPWFWVQIGDGVPYEVQPQDLSPLSFYPILDDALDG